MSLPLGIKTYAEYWKQLATAKIDQQRGPQLENEYSKILKDYKTYRIGVMLGSGIMLACLAVAFAPIIFTAKIILLATAGAAAIVGIIALVILLRKRPQVLKLSREISQIATKVRDLNEENVEKRLKELVDIEDPFFFESKSFEEQRSYYIKQDQNTILLEIALSIFSAHPGRLGFFMQFATPGLFKSSYSGKLKGTEFEGNNILERFGFTCVLGQTVQNQIEGQMLQELLAAGVDLNRPNSKGESIVLNDHLTRMIQSAKRG